MGIFKEKKQEIIDIAEFSGMKVSTGQVGSYIKKLYEEENFLHIGYRFEKNDKGFLRVILYTLPNSEAIICYFKDRCPGMIEDAVKKCELTDFKINKWNNGFEEVI